MDQEPQKSQTGGTLRRDLFRSVNAITMTMDPALVAEPSHTEVTLQLFDGLVQPDRQARPVPAIAHRWEMASDGLSCTFYLRPDVRFHRTTEKGRPTLNGGRRVTAHDFDYAWRRASDPALQSLGSFYFTYLSGWEAVDDLTFRVHLKQRFAPFLHLLLSPCFFVVPREDALHWGQEFRRHPVGTGAYRFAEQNGDRFMLLERNPDYFEGCSPIERVYYTFTSEDTERVAKLKRGLLDYEEIPDPTWWNEILAAPELRDQVITQTILGLTYVGLNSLTAPLAGERGRLLRQAICHAFDKTRFVREVRQGREQAAGGILPPGIDAFLPREPYPYDPAKSRVLLAQAGYPGGQGLEPLTIGHVTSEEHAAMAAAVQADLRRVGIRSEIWSADWPQYMERLAAGQVQLYLFGWIGDYADSSSFLSVLFHSQKGLPPDKGGMFYKDSRTDACLDEADVTLDAARRVELYQKAEAMIMENPPLLPLFYQSRSIIVRPWVHDFYLSPKAGLADILYKRMWLSERTEHVIPEEASRPADALRPAASSRD